MQSTIEKSKWHIAFTYSRCEKKVDERAKKQGLNTYLPLMVEERQWSDRIKRVETPLFLNYIFIKGTPREVESFRQIKEVVNFVYYNSKLATIRDSEIETIKKVVRGRNNFSAEPKLYKVGTNVKITKGPFVGVEGMLIRSNNKDKFVIQIETLGQSICVDVPLSYLASQ